MLNDSQRSSVEKAILWFIVPVVVIFLIILFLPRRKDIPIFDPDVTYYNTIYQELYPNATVLERKKDLKSYEIVFTTPASKDQVTAWYEANYKTQGWRKMGSFGNAEEEARVYTLDYEIDSCRTLGLSVIFDPQTQRYTHRIVLGEGRMCRRNL